MGPIEKNVMAFGCISPDNRLVRADNLMMERLGITQKELEKGVQFDTLHGTAGEEFVNQLRVTRSQNIPNKSVPWFVQGGIAVAAGVVLTSDLWFSEMLIVNGSVGITSPDIKDYVAWILLDFKEMGDAAIELMCRRSQRIQETLPPS